jgi:hypothetical protein
MLCESASLEATDPLDDGRDDLPRMDLKPPDSRTGDLGAVKGEKPEGGLAVRMTGGLAASSSRETSWSGGTSTEG